MPIQETPESSVRELTKQYRSIVTRVGEQSGKAILSGAKKAARQILDPQESEATLHLYEAVERNLFGEQSSPQPPANREEKPDAVQ